MESRRNKNIRSMTEEEIQFAEDALDEYRAQGSSTKRCPDCGSAFSFVDGASAYGVMCENANCNFRYTVRGI